MYVPPVALATEATRKQSSVENASYKTLICSVAADFARAQLRYGFTTEKVESHSPNAVALCRSDIVNTVFITGGLEPPL